MYRPIALLGALLAMLVFLLGSTPAAGAVGATEMGFPVQDSHAGQVNYSDTWGAHRSGGRGHEGTDVMAERMTPLVATTDGVITRIKHSNSGSAGNYLVLTDPSGWEYWYMHLNNDSPGTDDGSNNFETAFGLGIAEGVTVSQGQVVGYIGDSGNAEGCNCPHVHFEIHSPDGAKLNPYSHVRAAHDRLNSSLSLQANLLSEPVGRWSDHTAMMTDVLTTLEGKPPTAQQEAAFATTIGEQGPAQAIAEVVSSNSRTAQINRLYEAFFQRSPDMGGMQYWLSKGSQDGSVVGAARSFAASQEFRSRFGADPSEAFVYQLYQEVLGRDPDPVGARYWTEQLREGTMDEGKLAVQFTESAEALDRNEARSEIVVLYFLMHGRLPYPQEITDWQNTRESQSLADLIDAQFLS